MDYQLLSPMQLWSDFDDKSEPLATELLSEKHEQGVVTKHYRFVSFGEKKTEISTYAKEELKRKIALLYIQDIDNPPDEEMKNLLVDAGFVVVCCDFAEDGGAFSEHLGENCTSVDMTNWYKAAKILRRAVTFIESELKIKSVAVVAEKKGVTLSFMVAAFDKRIKALACLLGAGYRSMKGLFKYGEVAANIDEERECFITGVEPQSYAQYINIPSIFALATNDSETDIDRVGDLFEKIPSKEKSLIFSPLLEKQITCIAAESVVFWLKNKLFRVGKTADEPIGKFVLSDKKLYFKVKVDTKKEIGCVKIFSSKTDMRPIFRHWNTETQDDIGGGEYSALLKIYEGTNRVFAFAEVCYKDGTVMSTALSEMPLSNVQVDFDLAKAKRIIFENSFKTSRFSAATKGLISRGKGAYLKTGPMNISGITADGGRLKTYIAVDMPFEEDVTKLQFDAASKEETEISVNIYNIDEPLDPQTTVVKLTGSDAWERKIVPLESPDFAALEFVFDKVIFNNVILL
jgi:hypothetical protein